MCDAFIYSLWYLKTQLKPLNDCFLTICQQSHWVKLGGKVCDSFFLNIATSYEMEDKVSIERKNLFILKLVKRKWLIKSWVTKRSLQICVSLLTFQIIVMGALGQPYCKCEKKSCTLGGCFRQPYCAECALGCVGEAKHSLSLNHNNNSPNKAWELGIAITTRVHVTRDYDMCF